MTNSIEEITGCDTILVIGSNTTETHPVISYRIRQAVANGATLIVADPRNIDLVKIATVHLPLRPGTDVALINGLANVIISNDLMDSSFISDRTENYEKFKQTVEKYSPEYVAKITGVKVEDLIKAAKIYAREGKASILYTMGITQHTTGTDNVLSLANLAMLTGNIGRPSTGVNPLRGQNNVQGACDMGALPNVYTAYQQVGDKKVMDQLSTTWQIKLSNKPGLQATDMFQAVLDGSIKGMYIMGENPILSDPNSSHVIKALEKLDFLVVQDIFMNETSAYADVILPAAAYAERYGTYTNTERRVQLSYPAVKAPGEARPDWQIITELGKKMGFPWNYKSAEEVFAEIAAVTPSYGGLSYKRLQSNSLQWPCPSPEHEGTCYLHKDIFARGKGLFSAVEYKKPAEEPDETYPFILTTGRHLFHYHTGTMSRRSKGLSRHRPEEFVQVSPQDGIALGLQDEDMIEITSRRGQVQAKVRLTDKVAPGTVFMTFHYRETATNLLTNDVHDPVAGIPELKVCAVNIRKLAC